MTGAVTLVLGGARSGKSAFAERCLLQACSDQPPRYCATAEAWDDEMRQRIAQHRATRAGQGWITHKAPLHLAQTLSELPSGAPVLVDCLTLWLTNHMLNASDLIAESEALIAAICGHDGPVVAVANEVGLGIVPENALARRFRDAAGRLNQDLAARADRVVFVAAGLPLMLKGVL